jgi:soluble lytic murein transglycosylase-like protein
MKRLTVAAAALAAGMLTIVSHSHAESDRFLFRPAPTAKAGVARPAKTVETAGVSDRKTKVKRTKLKVASAGPKRSKVQRAKRGTMRIDSQETASIVRVRPELKATARKSVEGFNDRIDTGAANTEGYTTIVSRYAEAYGVPASLAHAVIRIESNYRPDKRGNAGEVGLMQIKPDTARMMGYSGSVKGLFDPETNIKYGMKYLAMAQQLSGGSTCGTILRYNAGHGATRMNPVSAAYCSKVKQLL